jgi:hypothetical protein
VSLEEVKSVVLFFYPGNRAGRFHLAVGKQYACHTVIQGRTMGKRV